MFFLKMTDISLLCSIIFLTLSTGTSKPKNILDTLFSNVGWKELNDVINVFWMGRYYTLSIEPKSTVSFGGKIRGATLILGCTFARDLKKIFLMLHYYLCYCPLSIGNTNIYNCTVELLEIIKKLSLLATIMKESLMALDDLHTKPWADYTSYTFYYHLSLLQRIPRKFVSERPLLNDPSTSLNILKFIKVDFETKEKDITDDLKCCKYVINNLNSIKRDLKDHIQKYSNDSNRKIFLDYVKEKLNNEMNNIVLKKYHNLGFIYNPQNKMIDVSIPDELKTNFKNKSEKSSTLSLRDEAIKYNQKSSAEIEDLLDFLNQGLKKNNLSEGKSEEPTQKKLKSS
ncbi:uncharacterized protein LOC126894328 [Daktulosphaira vitifoliae]|uniref:uncharacterized protein LOC126894328 n=1 Tax=Daktulosphaira vitifoliae TaxID=58002 RepID=UPI0021AA61F7|nr:uncharacterized protein LOC126894328 [Daktulosphaira vitifoliae]